MRRTTPSRGGTGWRRAQRACAALLVGVLAGCGGLEPPEIAAEVEGVNITSAQVDELYAAFAGTAAGQESLQGAGPDSVTVDPKQVRAAVLSYRIKIAFLEWLAEREKATFDDQPKPGLYEDLAQLGTLQSAGYRSQDLKAAARTEAISKAIAAKLLPQVAVTDEELRKAFEERQDLFGKSFRASTDIAFVASKTAADKLRSGLNRGAAFSELTSALGDEVLVSETVDLTPLSPLQPDLLDIVRNLDPGETAEPIGYQLGSATSVFVVMHQRKRLDLPAMSFQQARADLTKIVIDHKRFEFFEDWLAKQYETARIEVDEYYGRWNPAFQAVV